MKNRFIKSTIILIIGGFFTKILGLIIKIILTRLIGNTGIGLYSMILPTFLLLNSIAQLGFPTALNVLISSNRYNSKNLIITATIISLLIDFFIITFLIIFAKFISINLLNNKTLYLGLICIGFTLPFITISNMLRSYFFAKEKMLSHVITNIIEDLIKLLLIIIGVPIFLKKGLEITIAYIILTNIICELSSIIIFLIIMPNYKIQKKDLMLNKNNIKSLFKIALPTTGSRLIGSTGYFLEPIIITYVLTKVGYSSEFIVSEYGIINGYVMQLVLLPSFFTLAISQALIPTISNSYTKKDFKTINKKLKQAIIISLLIGIPATTIFIIFPSILLKLIFNTNSGILYTKFIAPICLFHYIQSPISSTLQALNKAKISMKGTLIGMIIRTLILFILSYFKIGLWSLMIATATNIVFVTLYDYLNIKKILKLHI